MPELAETSQHQKEEGTTKESNPSFEQQLEDGGKRKEGKGKDKSKPNKRKGEAKPSQPPAYQGKGEHAQLPKARCNTCWKKGHKTQACWWNSNQQHQQQHQQYQAWYRPSKPWQLTKEASTEKQQPKVYHIDKPTDAGLIPDIQPMLSFEHQSQASTSTTYPTQLP